MTIKLLASGDYLRASDALTKGWARLPGERGTPLSVVAAIALGDCYQHLEEDANRQLWFGIADVHAQQMMAFDLAMDHYWRGKTLAALGEVEQAKLSYQMALAQQVPYPARGEIQQILGEKITKSLPQTSIK